MWRLRSKHWGSSAQWSLRFEAHRSLIKSRPDRTTASKPASQQSRQITRRPRTHLAQQGSQDGRFQDTVELAAGRVAVSRQTIPVIIMESRNTPEPLGRGVLLFLRLQSIAVADIDRAVGAPFPAAVINVEMMAMAVMTMTMPMMVMTMAMPVVPVVAVAPTVAAMPAVTATASESLTWDGQGSGGQCQSRDRGRNDLLDLRHGGLLGWGGARVALR
jgi:hypothetical protein